MYFLCKRSRIILALLAAVMLLVLPAAGAEGQETVPADVLFDGTMTLADETFTCTASSGAEYTVDRLTPLGALDAVADDEGFTYVVGDKKKASNGFLLLDNISEYCYVKDGASWYYMVNGEPLDGFADASEGVDVYTLKDGDEVVFYYGEDGVTPETATALIEITVEVGEAEGWTLSLKGAVTDTIDQAYFEDAVDCGHGATYTDDDGNVWSGVPLWYLAGWVDDDQKHGSGAFNNNLASEGYSIKVTAGDDYSVNFESASVARNNKIIVANTLNGEPLPDVIGEKEKPCWPLQMVGADVTSGQKVGNVVEIELVGLPEPSDGWTITLNGKFSRTLTQAEFEEGLACGHAASYTDTDDNVWTGMPLWYLVGVVDDIETSNHWTFNDDLAEGGYTIEIAAEDGYTVTLDSADIAESDAYIVANKLNAAPLGEDDGYPLKLQGSGLTSGAQRVGTIASITLVNLPGAPGDDEWTLTLEGPAITAIISQTDFEAGAACHSATYNDGVSTWTGVPLWYLAGWVDDDVMHGSGAFNDNLASAGYTVIVSSGGDSPYSKEFTSQEMVANKNYYIVANKVNGSAITGSAFPLRIVGEGAAGSKSVGNIEKIVLTEFQEPADLPSVHVVRYGADGVTILNETTKTYQWMEENLPVVGGDDGIRLRFQGPTFDPDELTREQNVIVQAALHGVSLEGSTIYATHTPCVLCAKMLTNAKIARYVSFGKYNDEAFVQLFREAGIELDIKDKPPSQIEFLE